MTAPKRRILQHVAKTMFRREARRAIAAVDAADAAIPEEKKR